MARYSIISDLSNYICKFLKEKLYPEPMLSSQTIELVSPADENADYTLGIFMYDIRENMDHLVVDMLPTANNELRRPPKSLSIYYMIYVNASSQVSVKSADSQKILGRVEQVLNDLESIPVSKLQQGLEWGEENIRIDPSRLSYDEKSKIWTSLNKSYQVALFYTATPIMLSSEVVENNPMVTSISYDYIDKVGNS